VHFEQVIKAEDARLLAHMPTMRRAYNELHALNRELIGEYAKRANNHNQVHRWFEISFVFVLI
jgi:hypothetical protein